MDRDLIGEFIQEQQQQEPEFEVESANQAEQSIEDEDEVMMKFLPMRLMDDDPYADAARMNAKEAQSISSLKSKFDANVRALWNDAEDPLTKPLTHKSYDEGNASLVSSFASDKNSLSLFNFFGHQPHTVVAPIANNQMFGRDYLRVGEFDNNGSRGAVYKSHHSSSNVSPGTEKFIKLGTNVQPSIWSDGEFSYEPESLISKDVSTNPYRQTHRAPSRSLSQHVIHVSFLLAYF